MSQMPRVGGNLTGAMAAPSRFEEMKSGRDLAPPTSTGGAVEIAATRIDYADGTDVGTGSVPLPKGEKQLSTEMALFVDKLGERLAFERTGTRLYDALLSKHDAYGTFDGGPDRADLEEIRAEELAHFLMLKDAIERLGGDPTAVTPAANVAATASHGIGKVLQDPRTTLLQCLEAILIAELADRDCWEGLSDLARINGEDELAEEFDRALLEEEEHVASVRTWVALGQGREPPPEV